MDGGPFRQMQDNGQTDGRAGTIDNRHTDEGQQTDGLEARDSRQTYADNRQTDRRAWIIENRHTDAGQQTDGL
jgi:hypothetical protein